MEQGQNGTTSQPDKDQKLSVIAKERPKIYDLEVTTGVKPRNYEELASFAKLYLESGLAPKSFSTWQQVMVASAMCLEVGRPIATGLQDMAVINGRVGIFGDAALAVIRGSGILSSFREWSSGTPLQDDWTFYCKAIRKGEASCKNECLADECKDPFHCSNVGTWTWLEAKRAGFDDPKMRDGGKDTFSPWRRFTKRMMQFKARNFILRDKFGDVLKGITTVEDLMDSQELINVTPTDVPLAEKKAAATYEIKSEEVPKKPEGQGKGAPEKTHPEPAQEAKSKETLPLQTVIPPANGEVVPEEPLLYKVLKTARPGKGGQAKADFMKLVKDNIEEIEKWPEIYRNHILEKWEAKVSDPWPTYTAERPPEVKPEEPKEPTNKTVAPEKPLFEIDDGIETTTEATEAPSDFDILVAYLNGPVIIPADHNERLVSVTRFDAYIGKKMGDMETDLPLDAKTFMAFMGVLVGESKGKYKDSGSVKVAIWKQDLIEVLWMGYLGWLIRNDRKPMA